jgi:hypothetical protein
MQTMTAYSILSKIKKPQIKAEEFMHHYQIKDGEINRDKLQEFLDFFEMSQNDLNMKSKMEMLFALHGFCLDQEAEIKNYSSNLPAQIKIVTFSHFSKNGWVEGEINFDRFILTYGNKALNISSADQDILLQALKDLGIMSTDLCKINTEQTAGKVEIVDLDGRCYPAIENLSSQEMLFQIIDKLHSQTA